MKLAAWNKALFIRLVSILAVLFLFASVLPLSGCGISLAGLGLDELRRLGRPIEHRPGLYTFEGEAPPYVDTAGKRIKLVDNPDAADPTWDELKAFLETDNTDANAYIEGSYMCSEFATAVHNNAEAAGIRTAWVSLDFKETDEGHALNAFQTTDRGLVYIDCTGLNSSGYLGRLALRPEGTGTKGACDKVAYIALDSEFGAVGLAYAGATDYSFYVSYKAEIAAYEAKVAAYNAEVSALNKALGGRKSLDEPEYSEFKAWEARLIGMEEEIRRVEDELGDSYWDPLGTVTTVEIYW